jgi:dCMP deaminase
MRSIPCWDRYFLNIAEVVATRSKDPSTQVGAVLVNDSRHIIGTGYNGFPAGIPETPELWNNRDLKYFLVLHAEQNALGAAAAAGHATAGSTLYLTHGPCDVCAKMIVAAGIRRVVAATMAGTGGLHTAQEAGKKYLLWADVPYRVVHP